MPGNIPLPTDDVVASWPRPNYVDPVRRTWLPHYALILQLMASFLVVNRLVFRYTKHGGGLGLDDARLVPGWLLSIAFTIVAAESSNEGLVDRHVWDVRIAQYPDVALTAWISEFFFLLGTACVKISVLLFYRRLVQRSVSRNWRVAIWGAIVFTALWTMGLLFALIFNCQPIRAYWMAYDISWKHEYRCVDTRWVNPLTGVLGMVSDIYAVVLPWLLLRPLKMEARQKMQLNILFGLGVLVVAASAGRTDAMVEFGENYDLTWAGFKVYAFSLMEYHLGIMIACLPAMRALRSFMSRGSSPKGGVDRRITSSTFGTANEELDVFSFLNDQPVGCEGKGQMKS